MSEFALIGEQSPAQPAGEPNAQPQGEIESPFPTHADLMGGGFTGETDVPPAKAPGAPEQSEDQGIPAPPGAAPPAVDPRTQGLGFPPQNVPATYGSYYPPQMAPPQQGAPGAAPGQAPQGLEAPEALEPLALTVNADQVENPQDLETLNSIVDHVNKVMDRVNQLDTRHGDFRKIYHEAQYNQAKDDEYREMLWFDQKLQDLGEAYQGALGQGPMAALMYGSPPQMYRNKLWSDFNRLMDAYPTVPEEQVFNYAMKFAFPGHNGNQDTQDLRAKLKTRTAAGQPQPTRARRSPSAPQHGDQAALNFVHENFGDQLVPT